MQTQPETQVVTLFHPLPPPTPHQSDKKVLMLLLKAHIDPKQSAARKQSLRETTRQQEELSEDAFLQYLGQKAMYQLEGRRSGSLSLADPS